MRIHKIGLAAILALALTAAGCGGSSGNDDSEQDGGATSTTAAATTASTSKSTFIKKIDSVCTKVGERTGREFTNYAKENNIALVKGQEPKFTTEQSTYIVNNILLPALNEQADEIRQAGAPAGDEEQVTAIVSAIDEAIKKAEANPALAQSPEKLLADTDKLLQDYGFKVCGNR